MQGCALCLAAKARRTEWTGGWSRYECPTCWDFFIHDKLATRTHARLAKINNLSETDVAVLREKLGPIFDGVHLLSGTARLAAIEGREPRRFDDETAREAVRSATCRRWSTRRHTTVVRRPRKRSRHSTQELSGEPGAVRVSRSAFRR